MDYLREKNARTLILTVYVQPNASRDGIAGLHGAAVKLYLKAPPVEGKANKAAGLFLAELFKLPKSAVILQSGQQNRIKKFILRSLSLAEARTVLSRHLPCPDHGNRP